MLTAARGNLTIVERQHWVISLHHRAKCVGIGKKSALSFGSDKQIGSPAMDCSKTTITHQPSLLLDQGYGAKTVEAQRGSTSYDRRRFDHRRMHGVVWIGGGSGGILLLIGRRRGCLWPSVYVMIEIRTLCRW